MSDITIRLPLQLHMKIQILIQSLEKLGVSHLEYTIIIEGLALTAAHPHLAWGKKYKDEKLYKIDPLRRYALQTPFELISWDDISTQNDEESYVHDERKRICSVSKGVLISLKAYHYHEIFVFGSKDSAFDFIQTYRKNPRELCRIIQSLGDIYKSVYLQPNSTFQKDTARAS
jgi:hypothetical protein